MVDLAERTFGINNFVLAVEFYERAIKEKGPSSDLCLGLADCLAREGQFQRAFEAYSSAFRQGYIPHQKLNHLVTALVDYTKQYIPQAVVGNKVSSFFCSVCRNLLNDPVTIPCGHTFCRNCIQEDLTYTCKKCGASHQYLKISGIKTNVLLSDIIQKWFPTEYRAHSLKQKANKCLTNREFDKAIELYGEALQIAPADHLSMSNRSYALVCVNRYDQALIDAEHAINLRPDWAKGYLRKGSALFNLGEYEDAVVSYLQCVALDNSSAYARNYLLKALHKYFSILPPDDPKAVVSQQGHNPAVLQKLISIDLRLSPLMSQVNVDELLKLRDIVSFTPDIATHLEDDDYAALANVYVSQNELEYCVRSHESVSEDLKTKGFSAPSSRSSSPFERRNRSSSHSPTSLKRKRVTYKSGLCRPELESSKHCKVSSNERNPRINADLIKKEDFECALCYRLIFQPVSTPCGHAFCRQCLDRCLDHRNVCPLCKFSLVEYLADRRRATTECLEEILMTYLTQEYHMREKIYEEEVSELARMCTEKNEIPLFICTLAYPTLPCPLHIFEPRYRLMIRQCIESGTRQFGMCVAFTVEENCSSIGCMLEIRNVQSLPDGRSLVDTVGGRRFHILSKGTRDGYTTAKVEFIEDSAISNAEIEDVKKLQDEVYNSCDHWLKWLPPIPREQIRHHFGDFPLKDAEPHYLPNGPSWVWWMVAVLPLDPKIQLMMLRMTNLKDRLQKLQRVLGYLKRHQND